MCETRRKCHSGGGGGTSRRQRFSLHRTDVIDNARSLEPTLTQLCWRNTCRSVCDCPGCFYARSPLSSASAMPYSVSHCCLRAHQRRRQGACPCACVCDRSFTSGLASLPLRQRAEVAGTLCMCARANDQNVPGSATHAVDASTASSVTTRQTVW